MLKHLLVIGAQDRSVAKAALDADVTLFQVARLVSQQQIASARRTFVFGIESLQETLSLARTVHAYQPFDAVMSYLDAGLLSAAEVAEELSLPGNLRRPVNLTFDKLAMRNVLREHCIDSVPFRRCDSLADVGSFLGEIAGPIVLKPACGSGSLGVSKIDGESQIKDAFAWAQGAGLTPLIAEAYIDGPEYSVESLTFNGVHRIVAITEKFTSGSPHFIEVGHRLPALIPEAAKHRIESAVVRLLDVVGHYAGPAHTELRINRFGNPVIIETQTRIGGGQIWEMVEMVCGVDLIRETNARLLGLPVATTQKKAQAAAIGFLAHQFKTVRSVSGVEHAMMVPGVVRVDCRLQPGQRIGALASAKDRQGYVLAIGETPEAAWQAVQEALAAIVVEWEEQAPALQAATTSGCAGRYGR